MALTLLRTERTRAPRPAALVGASVLPRDWRHTFERLAAADARGDLAAADLERLAEAARWTGHDAAIVDPLERAHAAYTAHGDAAGAARTALALVHVHRDHCREAVASSWLARAAAVLERLPEGAEHAWLAWYHARAHAVAGEVDALHASAQQALDGARRHGDRSLEALALLELAHHAAAHGAPSAAFPLAEQATAIVLAGEAGILAAGEVLCGTIWLCRSRGLWDRAQQWIDVSTRWVERLGVQYLPGMCRMHRAEVLRIRGHLAAAEQESLLATSMLAGSMPSLSMLAFAELGEARRRRGDTDRAMDAFGRAVRLGWDPQPGLALLLAATGRPAEAQRMLERTFRAPAPTYLLEDRANLQAARTIVALANGDLAAAADATSALERLADGGTAWDEACAAEARGRLELARGHADAAIDRLLRARRIWTGIDAPFELAAVSVVLGDALTQNGDVVHAQQAKQAAHELFARLLVQDLGEHTARRLAGLHTGPRPPVELAAAATAAFVHEGDCWSVHFAGRVVRIHDGRGARYLAALLARPGEPHWALELAAGVRAVAAERSVDAGDAGPLLDVAARQRYARRVRELEDELAEARRAGDAMREDAVRHEMDALGQQLAAAVGLGGRARRAGSAVERARQSVTKAIRGVVRKLAAAHEPLGEHLRATVRTGTACTYAAGEKAPMVWTVLGL